MKTRDFIWDLGGTLLDNYQLSTQAFLEALAHFGIEASADQVYDKLKVSTKEAIAFFIPNEPAFQDYYKSLEAEKLEAPLLFEGAREALEKVLACGGRNFLISHRNHQVKQLLVKTAILEYFTEIVTSDNGFARKPNPESFLYLKDKYDLEDALVIGDREIDIEAGQAAGFATCLFDGKNLYWRLLQND
ncbi:HAD-IA family hydrolase [Streptococcus loxodontisalivarius]|uniref:HAD superfamily hydrolase (TIGR01549 family) n=1 Tax=Streptococcus loxodontisalivarius TaxID=1349415 RepID=A0ABS2PRP2_9STRE|nr:HAD-IA family hydrolase [Streptococcus loxodontisalivarius]MBM7642184.1 HAD superfamily hydrolase (TIGR01549 family) [Streptococcus loxodontisalivarius]